VGTAGGQRAVNFINFLHLMLKFHELKLINQAGLSISFEAFVDGCLA